MTNNDFSTTFDQDRAYQQKGTGTYFNDGREVELLHYVHERSEQVRDSPSGVLAAIDDYGVSKKYLMNIGQYKGRIVSNLIQEHRPQVMVELGGYVGYSSIMFGDAFRKAGGKRYYALEDNPEFAAVIMGLVKLAGLSDVVSVIVGDSAKTLRRLHSDGLLQKIDLLFIDHTEFGRDTKLCEELGLISPGTLIVADNCIYPGHPDYWDYVTASVADKRAKFHQEKDSAIRGNPNLAYECRMEHSFEPSGEKDAVGISKCVRREGSA